ncbi:MULTISPECIES: hypothetical protein [unclassified Tenacibaculum]|nr:MULTISPECIES: hypothetical protein [unclassified Tenacibaculum]
MLLDSLKAFFVTFLYKPIPTTYNQKVIAMSFGGPVSAMITN